MAYLSKLLQELKRHQIVSSIKVQMVGNTKSRFVEKIEATTINDLIVDIKKGKPFLPL